MNWFDHTYHWQWRRTFDNWPPEPLLPSSTLACLACLPSSNFHMNFGYLLASKFYIRLILLQKEQHPCSPGRCPPLRPNSPPPTVIPTQSRSLTPCSQPPMRILLVFNTHNIYTIFEMLHYIAFSHHWQGSIDFNTVNTTRPTGMYFLIHP